MFTFLAGGGQWAAGLDRLVGLDKHDPYAEMKDKPFWSPDNTPGTISVLGKYRISDMIQNRFKEKIHFLIDTVKMESKPYNGFQHLADDFNDMYDAYAWSK